MINKKGIIGEQFLYMAVATIILLTFSLVFFINTSKVQAETYVSPINEQNIVEGIFYKGSCFAYTDKRTGTSFGGEIDLNKFTQENLNSCYGVSAESNEGCFKLLIKTYDNTLIAGPIQTRNFQLKCFGHTQKDIVPIILWDGQEFSSALLEIEEENHAVK